MGGPLNIGIIGVGNISAQYFAELPKLPNLNPFIDAMGQIETMRLLGHTIFHPGYWPGLMRLGRASANGANYLSSAILHFLVHDKQRNVHEINRTGVIPD